MKVHILSGSLSLFRPRKNIYKKELFGVSFILFSDSLNVKIFPIELYFFHTH